MKNSNDFCFCSELKTNSEILLVRKGLGRRLLQEPKSCMAWRALCAPGGKPLLSPAKLLWGSSGRQAGSVILCRWF